MKLLLALTVMFLSGCASVTTKEAQPTPTPAPATTAAPPTLVADVFSRTKVYWTAGQPATWDDVIKKASEAEVVVIAEQHGHPVGLSAAAALWRETLKHSKGKQPALALEFFERDDQSRIDDYLAGLSTEEVFLKRTGKTNVAWDGGYPPGHRDMVEAAKADHLAVYAANAPRAYVRLARTSGYAALERLTPEQQRLFALPRFAAAGRPPENRYWRDFLTFMDTTPEKYAAGTVAEREKVDSMFRAESIWDATMADTVRKALADGGGHSPVFLVVGQFHADYSVWADAGGGTVLALRAVRPTKVLVVSFQDAEDWRDEDKGRADFVVFCGPRPDKEK
ncbi:MAG: ChaN family lipoprotein [Phycisphaerales bacterium]